MRIGRNLEVRPLGGAMGCLGMILFSIVASVVLTILLNLIF
jgi:putative effector of murein hydrolase